MIATDYAARKATLVLNYRSVEDMLLLHWGVIFNLDNILSVKKNYDDIKASLESQYSVDNTEPLSSYNKTSKEKVLWYCERCDEDYPAQIRKRVYEGSGCPNCGKRRSQRRLSEEFPHLVDDYDNARNVKPLDYYSRASEVSVWWLCHRCGDSRKLPIKSRASRGYGCKICTTRAEMSRRNDEKLSANGSFASNYPELASQWDYENNSGTPDQYLSGSGEKIQWVCDYGHTWKATINDRVKNNSGCRKCGNQSSQYEIRLFSELKILDSKVQWNTRVDGVECDIFLPSMRLAIEIDGYPWHDSENARARDKRKAQNLNDMGIKLLRYRDSQLRPLTDTDTQYLHEGDQFPSFLELLRAIAKASEHDGFKAKIAAYIEQEREFVNEQDFQDLYRKTGKRIFRKSLLDEFPQIAKEWSSKNEPLRPDQVYSRGKKNVWWDCPKCGKSYQKRVGHRTRNNGNGEGCSCNGTRHVDETNNLVALRGGWVNQLWDFELNENSPESFRPHSQHYAWFKCPNGHSFEALIGTVLGDLRSQSVRCRSCGHRIPKR